MIQARLRLKESDPKAPGSLRWRVVLQVVVAGVVAVGVERARIRILVKRRGAIQGKLLLLLLKRARIVLVNCRGMRLERA